MNNSMLAEIQRIRSMTVGELQLRWRELYGEESRSRNREFLFRRLAWRIQELQHGGLSDRAKARLEQLAPDSFIRARTSAVPPTLAHDAPTQAARRERTTRDPRLPTPGTVITRTYRGRELRLTVLEDGFELGGVCYGSLSEATRAVTGAHWNGRLFWGLAKRSRT